MKYNPKVVLIPLCLLGTILFVVSCLEKKEGKVIVTESEFVIRQDKGKAYVIDARGKVRNVGEVDVKQVVVTGFCRSCIEMIKPGYWFVSGSDKMPEQKDTIGYLAVGAEESFSFKEVAFMYNMVAEKPESMPEKLEAVVASFETD